LVLGIVCLPDQLIRLDAESLGQFADGTTVRLDLIALDADDCRHTYARALRQLPLAHKSPLPQAAQPFTDVEHFNEHFIEHPPLTLSLSR
jgi:hypothetical protein